MDVFEQQQHLDAAFRVRLAPVHFVQEQELVERRHDEVGLGGHFFAVDVFGEGEKLIGQPGFLQFVVGVAVADDVHVAGQVEALEEFHLAAVLRKHVADVVAGDVALVVVGEGVGKHVVGADAHAGNDGFDEFAETAGNNENLVGKFTQKLLVALKRIGDFRGEVLHEQFEVVAVGAQKFDATRQGFGEGDFAVHAQFGNAPDFGDDALAVFMARQADVGQFIQPFDFRKGAVEVNNEEGLFEGFDHESGK